MAGLLKGSKAYTFFLYRFRFGRTETKGCAIGVLILVTAAADTRLTGSYFVCLARKKKTPTPQEQNNNDDNDHKTLQ